MSLSSNINQLATRIGTEMAGQDSRIAALEGAAPIQIEGRVTALETAMAMLEAQRKLSIGCPKFWRSTTLPANHAYPDGSLIKFADWPEFKAVYDAGGFAGMLMPWNADAATQAANLGKYRPNSANPTGLYLPLHGGQFFRAWALGADGMAGGYNAPGLPEINGRASFGQLGTKIGALSHASGALSVGGEFDVRYWSPLQNGAMYSDLIFTASQSNSFYGASSTVMPPSVDIPVILYLGRPR